MHISMLGLEPTLLVGVLAQISLGPRGWVFTACSYRVPDIPCVAFPHPYTFEHKYGSFIKTAIIPIG